MIKFLEKNNKISWAITILIAITIFVLSSMTFGGGYGTTNINSTIYHFTIFFFLGFFLLISLLKGKDDSFLLFIGIMIAIAYGITDELHQFFVPGRFCSLIDAAFDTTGILFAGVIYFVRVKIKKGR